mgnify:FL=1
MLPPFNLNGNDPVLFATDLVIPAGITLTITDLQLFFSYKNRILVQRGGSLQLIDYDDASPTRITGLCNMVWQGIQVEGPGQYTERNLLPFEPVTAAANFGEVVTTGAIHIDDAIFGIVGMSIPFMDTDELIANLIAAPNPFPPANSGIYNSTFFYAFLFPYIGSTQSLQTAGGAVKVRKGTTFTNCFEGVNLSYYKNGECIDGCHAVVDGAEFTTTALLYPFNTHPQTLQSEAGIHLINYTNLPINDNDFTRVKYGVRGILTNRISCTLNTFSHCKAGISASNTGFSFFTEHTLDIINNTFERCDIAIQASGAIARIHHNAINENLTGLAGKVGIFLMGGAAHVVSNRIYQNLRAIALLSCQTAGTEVRLNRIQRNFTGILLYGNNKGVTISCNDFYDYGVAIAAGDYILNNTLFEAGDMIDQGDCYPTTTTGTPADNRFFPAPAVPTANALYSAIFTADPPVFTYFYRNETPHIPVNFLPFGSCSATACEIPNVKSYSQNCGDGPQMIREDEDIKNLTDEDRRNAEMLRKLYYYADEKDTLAARLLLQDINSYLAKRLLLPYYLQTRQFTPADSLLLSLPTERPEEQHFSTLYGIYRQIFANDTAAWSLTLAQETQVRAIAATYTPTSFDARNLLYLLYGEEYLIELPPLPEEAGMENRLQTINVQFKSQETAVVAPSLKVYPNPAKDGVTIAFPPLENGGQFEWALYHYTGKQVHTLTAQSAQTYLLDTQTFAQGLYYYRVYLNGEAYTQGKLIIVK